MLAIKTNGRLDDLKKLNHLLDHFNLKTLDLESDKKEGPLPHYVIISHTHDFYDMVFYYVDEHEAKKIERLFSPNVLYNVNESYKKLKNFKLYYESSGLLRRHLL